ncbi:NAD(P)/FAD-dependent oxidoreductase [Parapedobacter sp. ISTM3]|uniref:All-trans-retinol 13,14-reductase n=1 Tax=Parapedobacter luteus TaxID=623280 RepID=A0A1T5DSN1_9SPHI|nr:MULTISPECIES: NAD(P)/FAD-dependent oxidoreductase [Parapedobacter]MBK1440833.1 NAD(P)/FAD-dependent oxidoreductase [Parapedobacter sp. ISTM3]SKB74802.1 all-trans-retinol 13,14-reductase [Parapedobacter luteus]
MHGSYDVIVIGSGLGGLVCATTLAKEGLKVLVLEKNKQYGGNLQTFVRNRCIFDTGVHYIGGLDRGQNLYQYFQYLGIADKLRLKRMDQDAFDVVTFDNDPNEYPYAQGGANFVEQLSRHFPEERAGIERFYMQMKAICQRFPLYRLDMDEQYQWNAETLGLKVSDVIDSCTANPKLRAVLAGTNLLYAGIKDKTPFYVHALSINSYIESAWRCINGGGQIAKLLIRELHQHGGKALKHQEVTQFHIENGLLQSVTTAAGNNYRAETFISNMDPKKTLQLIGDYPIRKSYASRIRRAENTISSFSLYLVLKPRSLPYLNRNYYHFKDEASVWSNAHYRTADWPNGYMVSMNAKHDNDSWADTMTVFTYMRFDEVNEWANTYNTVAQTGHRGDGYEQFKRLKTEIMLDELEKKFPDLRRYIDAIYVSTPLTYRDYIGNETGGMYGFVKDANQPLNNSLPPRTKIKNLLLTGQGVSMHGILGVTINAILTCTELLGKEYLLEKITAANQTQPLIEDSYGNA